MKKLVLIIAVLGSVISFASCTRKVAERDNTQRDETTRREAARAFEELEEETDK